VYLINGALSEMPLIRKAGIDNIAKQYGLSAHDQEQLRRRQVPAALQAAVDFATSSLSYPMDRRSAQGDRR
jgi:hypothetical protein